MAYIGSSPANKPLTSSDITDGIIVTADIADAQITSAKLASGTGGKVLQVVQVVKTDTVTVASASFTDVTGMSVSITPSSTSSKILIMSYVVGNAASMGSAHMKYLRDSTALNIGDASSSRSRDSTAGLDNNTLGDTLFSASFVYLDSPSSTSSLTYKLQVHGGDGNGIVYINKSRDDGDSNNIGRGGSSIIVMEISA